MDEIKHYRVDNFLLSKDWRDTERPGLISYVIRGGESFEKHVDYVSELKEKLIIEHDDNYTSWVFVDQYYHDIGGIDPHCTVIHFRVRDAY
jgi:hypothetical protein